MAKNRVVRRSDEKSLALPVLPWLLMAKWLLVVLIALSLVIGAKSVRWPIQSMQIDGRWVFASEKEVRQALEAFSNEDFLRLDLAVIKAALIEAPWLEDAQVERRWPGVLSIAVKEHQPLARWNEDYLINADGAVFGPVRTDLELSSLLGEPGQEQQMMQRFLEISQVLLRSDFSMQTLSQDEVGGWLIRLVQGPVIKLGTRDVEGRLGRALQLLRSGGVEVNNELMVDARYSNGVAYKIGSGK